MPGGQQARAVFDAVEQARVEAIGSRRMGGREEQSRRHARRPLPSRQIRRDHRPRRCADRGRARHDRARAAHRRAAAGDRAQAGRSVAPDDRGARRPQSRPAGTRADRSAPLRRRRARPARFARHGRGSQQRRRRGGRRGGRRGKPQATNPASDGEAAEFRRQRAHEPGRGRGLGRGICRKAPRKRVDAPAADMADDAEMGDSETAAEPWRPRHQSQRAARSGLSAVHRQVRRDRRRRKSLRSGRARTAARLSRQAAVASAGRGGAARQPAAAAVDGAAEPRLGIRSGRRPARSGAAAARHRRSAASAVVQAREGHRFPRYGGDAAARQFRLDARASDHGGGDLRRYPGAHAGALRRQGGDFGLHHARLEGRAIARSVARARASRPIPGASTICATSSTSRPTRPGGARARISA